MRRGGPLQLTGILEDFSSTLLLQKKRGRAEMRTPEMLEVWLADQGASTQVSAVFDDEMMLVLRPAVF